MSVIELGELGSAPVEPPPRWRPRSRRWPVIVALTGALTLGAAVPPAGPPVRQLWTAEMTEAGALAFTEDTVYAGDERELTAYDLATGAVRWRHEIDATDLYSLGAADGMVQVAGPTVHAAIPDGEMIFPAELTVLDAATGAERWRSPGDVLHSTPASVLLADRDTHGELHAIRLAGAHDGAIRWELPLTHVLDVQVGDGRIVTATTGGDLATFRYTDGAPLAVRHVEPATDRRNTVALVTGGRLLMTRADPRGATVTAYRLDDLAELWSRRALRAAYVIDCGPVLCLSEGAEVTGLDAATGTSRWRLTGRGGVNTAGPGRLLAYSTDEQPVQTLISAATGETLADAGTGWPMSASAATGPDLLLRPSGTDPDRTVISRIEPDHGRVTPIGTIDTTENIRCDGTGRYLLCRRPGHLVVTTLR